MAAGDVTVLGPYDYNDTATMDTALTAIQSGAATDQTFPLCSATQFWIVWIEGA